MHEWAATAPEHWGIDPDAMLAPATGGRLPMAGAINPKSGPTWIAIGDAAGSINPFNGEGIDYAYETARMAAGLIDAALVTGSAMPPSSETRRVGKECVRTCRYRRVPVH